MKQCPTCERIYDDVNLFFCTEDGARLVTPYNSESTHAISPTPPVAVPPPPTLAYNATPPPAPPPLLAQTPAPRRGPRPVVLGLAVIGVLLVGLLIGVWLSQRPGASSSNLPPATPTPSHPAPSQTPTPTPTPILVVERPTPPPSPTPVPSPLASPSPKNVESGPRCVLYNDKAERSGVVTRSDCDTKDCEADASTKGSEYPDDTPVLVVKGSGVKGKRFTWVKVLLVEQRQTVWVAATKIRCE